MSDIRFTGQEKIVKGKITSITYSEVVNSFYIKILRILTITTVAGEKIEIVRKNNDKLDWFIRVEKDCFIPPNINDNTDEIYFNFDEGCLRTTSGNINITFGKYIDSFVYNP